VIDLVDERFQPAHRGQRVFGGHRQQRLRARRAAHALDVELVVQNLNRLVVVLHFGGAEEERSVGDDRPAD
jgi:hypothetical protein